MTFRVYYDPFLWMNVTTYSQRFRLDEKMILSTIRCSLVMLGNAAFTNMRARLFAERTFPGGVSTRGVAIANSTPREKAEFTDIGNGYYDIAFNFPLEVWLSNKSNYYVAILADDYTYSDGAHVGWVRDWPDATYDEDLVSLNPARAPYRMHIAGKRFFGI